MRRPRRLVPFLLLTVLLVGASVAGPAPLAQAAGESEDQLRSQILADTNAARASAGLLPLIEMPALTAVAEACSDTQATARRMAHCDGYAGRYPAGWTRAAENVAYGYRPADVVAAWMGSDGHRRNILDPSTTHIGIGIQWDSAGRPYYTQDFASYPWSSEAFGDVSASTGSVHFSAFASEITWVKQAGVSTGYPHGSIALYKPFNAVTRDAMAAFLYRAAGSPAYVPPAVSPFVDVPRTHLFYKEIAWLAGSGVATGWTTAGGSEFRPSLPISRDAMAAFLYRFAGSPSTPAGGSAFVDVPASHPFHDEIAWLSAAGISTGWTAGGAREFRPSAAILRDAMAAFLYRYSAL